MPKKVWTAQDEEERKRRRAEVEAQRAQQVAEHQALAQADEATKKAHRESVTKTGNEHYSQDVYNKVIAENRGYQAEVQRQTAGKYAPSQYKHAYENVALADLPTLARKNKPQTMVKFDGDYSRFKNENDVYNTALGIKDADQQERFLKGWGEYTSSTDYKNRQARTAAMNSLAGLYDVNGNAININTASYSQVVQGIRSIADKNKRDAAIKNLETLVKTEGSRFYGQTIDKEQLKTYLSSPDFTEDDFDNRVAKFDDAFYPQSGHEEQNAKKYMELLSGIQNLGYSADVQRQLIDRLNEVYKDRTGKDAPKLDEIKTAQEEDAAEEKSGGLLDGLLGLITGGVNIDALGDKANSWDPLNPIKKDEMPETPKPTDEHLMELFKREVQEDLPGIPAPKKSGKIPGSTLVASVTRSDVEPPIPKQPEAQGPVQRKVPSLAQALAEGIPAQKEQVITEDLSAPDAYLAWRKGYKLSDENMAKLKPYLSNPDIRAGLLMATEKAGAERELTRETDDFGEYVPHETRLSNAAAETARYSKMGKSIASAAVGLDSGAVPDDMAAIGRIMLGDVAIAVQSRVQAGILTVPEGANMYEYALSLDEGLRQQVEQVKSLPKVVGAIKTENAVKAAKSEQQAMEDAYAASAMGDATDEQMSMLAQRADIADIDVNDDGLRARFMFQLNPMRSTWYEDGGAFWSGDSAAAQEGQRLIASGKGYSEYKHDLKREAEQVIDEYTRVAHSHGMDLEKYLSLTGMELDDLMDITYNRMTAVGAAVLADPEMPAVIDSAASKPTKSIGVVASGIVGAGAGLVSYAEGFMNAPYQIIDVATYEARRDKLLGDYEAQYGEQAPYVYRKDLLDYAKSGKLDKASSEALLANIQRANDIFDVAFEIDPGFFAGAYRDSMESLGKTMDAVAELRSSLPKAEQIALDGMSMITSNAAGMLVSTTTGNAVRGMGFGAKAARVAGSTMAYGGGSFMDAYTEGTHMGLTDTMAAWRGLSRAVGTIAMNMGGTDSMIDLYGGSAARRGFEAVARQNKSVALAVVKGITKHGIEEGVEEIAEVGVDKALDLFDGAVMELDQGKPLSASMIWRSATNTFTGMDVEDTLKEIAQAGMGGFFAGALFSAGGVALDGIEAKRGVKMENQYASIKMAGQIVRGEVEPTEEKMAEFAQALAVDVKDANYCTVIDQVDAQAREATNMVTAALTGAGVDARNAMITENQKANAYEEKAAAAEQAVTVSQNEYLKARMDALRGSVEAAKKLEGYRTAWAKAGTTLKENHDAAEKARQLAGKHLREWLGQCRVVASLIGEEQLRDAQAQMVNARNAVAEQIVAEEDAEIAAKEDAPIEVDAAEQAELDAERAAIQAEAVMDVEAPAAAPVTTEYTDADAPPEDWNADPVTGLPEETNARIRARAIVQANMAKSRAAEPKKEAPAPTTPENVQADYVSMDGVKLAPTPTKGKANKNPIQTFNRLAKDFGVGKVFGTRKLNGLEGKAAGYYETKAKYVAVGPTYASSIEVDAHELGHAIADKLGVTGTQQMVNNLTPRFKANYKAAELPGEAFAEFFWRYMVNDHDAENFAGTAFVNDLERRLRKQGLLKSVKTAQTEVRRYLLASADEQTQLMIRDKSDTNTEDTIGEKLMDAERVFISSMVDSTRAAEDVNDKVREQAGAVAEEDNLRNAALMQGHATKRAATVLNDHLTDVNGTVVGDSLKKRLADAGLNGKDFNSFVSYLLNKHSLDRDKQSKAVLDRGAISADSSQKFIDDMDRQHPEFKKAAEAFQSFRHDFMTEYMVKTGFMEARTLALFEAMYPNYVPTYRVKDRGRRGIGGQTYTVMGATGSTEQILNPIDSFVDMVNTIVAMNLRNETYKVFDRVYNRYEGMGIFGREVQQDRVPDKNFATTQDEVLEILLKADADDDVIRQVLNTIGRPHNTNDVNLPNVIRVQMEDGSVKFYEIFDKPLFDMFAGTPDSGLTASKIIGNLTSFMTAMTTGSNPIFGARNFLRDFQNSVNYGSWAGSYMDGMGKWLSAAWDVFRDGWIGEHTGLNANNATYEQYKALGGGGWTRIETKTKKGAAAYRGELLEGYNTSNLGRTAKWAGKKLWNAVTLARLNEIIEQTSRYAEYKYGKHDLSTVEGRRDAFLASQDVTTDFSRRGNSALAREAKALFPFFNASLQGIYRTGRQFTAAESDQAMHRFIKTVINAGLASALANLWLLANMDDEDKEEFFYLSDDLKAKHVYIPNLAPDVFGEAPMLRIPLNQDPLAYAIHAAVTNAVWYGEGEEWAVELAAVADNILSSLNPVSSTVFDPLIAVKTNKNWYGSNIVPRSMEGELATNQYTAETPEMFKWASHALYKASGRKTEISPMMLQYIAEQYSGFVGQMVIPFFSKNEFTGEINGIEAVIEDVRKTLTSDPLKSNDIVSTVYDNDTFLGTVTKAGSRGKPMDMLRSGLSKADADRAYDEAYEMTHKGGIIYDTKKAITAGYDKIDEIEARTDLTDEQKYLLQSEVRREMIELALDANEAMAEFREKYIEGERFLTRFMRGTIRD